MSVLRLASRFSLSRQSAFGLALLTCAALVAVPAHAQILDLGKSVPTLSGTATITDSGTTASGTYQYRFNNSSNPTPLDPSTTSYGYVRAYGNSTANVSGGSISAYLATYDTSTTNVSGGDIFGFSTYDTSTANVSGGSLYSLTTFSDSTANVSGGSFSDGLFVDPTISDDYDASIGNTTTANVSGGDIFYLETFNNGTANVSGGNFVNFYTFGNSTANVSGGNISSNLGTRDTSTLNLFGTGFTETFLGDYSYLGYQLYSVSGTLENGDSLNVAYYDFGGKLVFNPVPEASTMVSFGLLLILGMGGMMIAARKKKTAAAV